MNTDDKKRIRKKMLQIREGIRERTARQDSEKVCDLIMSTDVYKNAKTILCYFHIHGEVMLDKLIEGALRDGKNILVPAIDNNRMYLVQYDTELEPGLFGTREPVNKKIYKGHVDLALIPSLACDDLGGRLGYGVGYYDRYYGEKAREEFDIDDDFKLAPVYDFQLTEELPLEPHDILLNMVVTPTKIIVI